MELSNSDTCRDRGADSNDIADKPRAAIDADANVPAPGANSVARKSVDIAADRPAGNVARIAADTLVAGQAANTVAAAHKLPGRRMVDIGHVHIEVDIVARGVD